MNSVTEFSTEPLVVMAILGSLKIKKNLRCFICHTALCFIQMLDLWTVIEFWCGVPKRTVCHRIFTVRISQQHKHSKHLKKCKVSSFYVYDGTRQINIAKAISLVLITADVSQKHSFMMGPWPRLADVLLAVSDLNVSFGQGCLCFFLKCVIF